MTASKLRPKVVLWWGIGLTVAGLLLTTFVPQVGYLIAVQHDASSGVDQGLLVGLNLVVSLIAQVIPPLGVALIGAAVVMTYIARLTATTSTATAAHSAELPAEEL